MLSEFREEAVTTKRILDRVPADKLSWRLHAKSMSLGQLALHIATIPGSMAKLASCNKIHAATHPGAKLEHKPSAVTNDNGQGEEEQKAALLALEAESDEEE